MSLFTRFWRVFPLLVLLLPGAAPAPAGGQVPWSIRPPGTAVKNPPFPRDDDAFLDLASRRLLGRKPLLPEREQWSREAAAGSPGRERVLMGILSSDEYFVRHLFLDVLQREPGKEEMRRRLDHLRQGGSRTEVLRNLLESEEFRRSLR